MDGVLLISIPFAGLRISSPGTGQLVTAGQRNSLDMELFAQFYQDRSRSGTYGRRSVAIEITVR